MHRLKQTASLFGRFLAVGLGGTLVNLVCLAALVWLGWPQLPAALLATEIAIIHNFLWNDAWTFRGQAGAKLARFGRFQLVTTFTSLFSLGLFWLFNNRLGWHYLLAQLVAIGLATLLNFGANALLTWGQTERRNILAERHNF